MEKLITNTNQHIENMIYEIRGVQVMLSSDVAKLYHVETKALNQTIKRNINRFPESFCFQLTDDEIDDLSLRSQFVTLNKNNNLRGQHYKYLPYVLTEQGIMMLSGLLKSDIAAQVNVQIIDAFVKMKKYISTSILEQRYINDLVLEDHKNIKILQESFSKLENKQKINSIFYKGQIFDAYIVLKEICESAKKEIIIIDDYAGKELLSILRDIDTNITLVSANLNDIDINKYKEQYNNVTIKHCNYFHDRFIIVDKKDIYHSGASFKDLGKKCFAITKIEEKELKNKLLDIINITLKK